MSSTQPPMPSIVGDEEDTRTSVQNSVHCESHTNEIDREMSITTKTTSTTHHFNWAIDSRSLSIARLASKGERRGVIEACVEKEGIEFKLELCASGWRNSQDGYSAFYLTVKDEGESFVGRYRVKVGDITRISSIRHDFHLGVGFPNFCAQTAMDALVADENLNFQVTVEVFRSRSQVVRSRIPPMRNFGRLNHLSSLVENIHAHRFYADVVLVCQGHRIPAHKAFLSSASPVFRAMFSQPFLESTSKEVSLDRFLPQTVNAMIRFLYTAKLEFESDDNTCTQSRETDDLSCELDSIENNSELMNCDSVACQMEVDEKHEEVSELSHKHLLSADSRVFNLFQFAEMYKMTSLVIACCKKMCSTISVENTCDLLIQLDRYSHVPEIAEIQESIWNFVKENYNDIKKTSGFARMVQRHPNVVAQLMDQLL